MSTENSLVDLLRRRAAEQPESVPYTFLDGDAQVSANYREMDTRARVIAAAVREHCRRGDRVVLVLPPGLDYVAAYYGCLYAGVIAVPVYPPHGGSMKRSLTRLASIIVDAAPTAALTLDAIADQSAQFTTGHPVLESVRWIGIDALTEADGVREPEPAGRDDLAFLQYTSGSTAAPKGVMVSHGNLLANGADIERFFEFTPQSKTVIWLPPYHDMGLIGGILQALYSGFPTVLMSPVEFARTPLRWLRAISDHRATCSGGPNFAYELCVRKIKPADLAGVDLSCWRLAFNGAEPIRPDVMARFTGLVAPAGFRHEAFYPCYGLAEGTLIATGGKAADAPAVLPADPAAGRTQPLVGCGSAAPGQRLAIVDPNSGEPCCDGGVGEIWIAGPSVAQGYWGRPRLSDEVFRARVPGDGTRFLRTGDLGFQKDGQLYVSGRLKDLIIQRGVNHYPQDVEYTAVRAHPVLRPNGGACFTIPVDGTERVVVAHEVAKDARDVNVAEIAAAVRAAVGQDHLLSTYAVVVLRPGGLPRTSSGKVQRHAVRAGYLDGTLDMLGSTVFARDDPAGPVVDESVEQFVRTLIARHVADDPAELDLAMTGPALGLDSVAILEVRYDIEARFRVALPPDALYDGSIEAVVRTVASAADSPQDDPDNGEDTGELSHGQRGLWFLDRMTGCGAAYNIAAAVRLPRDIDPDRLETALGGVVDRHGALRTTFPSEDGQPRRRVEPAGRIVLDRETLARETMSAVASKPFDLEQGPLLRVYLGTRVDGDPVLLLVIHHIVADFLSMSVMVDELIQHYQAGGRADLPPAGDYAEHVRWQRDHLASDAGKQNAAYWKQQLAGDLPVLELPTDRPRPARQTFSGDSVGFDVDSGLYRALRALARKAGTTPHTLLLCAFEVLLHRYSGQTDILVATPAFGRSRRSSAETLGYFVNPVVIRGDLSGDPTFTALLTRFARTVADGLAHQDFPFGLLGELVRVSRDPARSPIFQAMFVHHQSPSRFPAELSLVAVGDARTRLRIAGMPVELVPMPLRTAQFDLTMSVAENNGALAGSVRFNTDLFDKATIADFTANFVTLLRAIASDADRRIGVLPLLNKEKWERAVSGWNDTGRPLPAEALVHEAFDKIVTAQPDAVAVVFRSVSVTYRDLAQRADRLARHLIGLGVGPESHVGMCVDRSPDLLVALLGILKAGCAYVPLDPQQPRERNEVVITDAMIDVLVTKNPVAGKLPATGAVVVDLDEVLASDQPGTDTPAPRMSPDSAAYVLYTSGSSGVPKGVVVSHRNVANFFTAMDERVGCGPRDTMLAVTSVAFDISVLELLWTVSRGAKVVLAEDSAMGRVHKGMGTVSAHTRNVDFSLFYFASAASASGDHYRLVFDGARFADRHGFTAVWTPERHFHEFGGLYPNPSVLSAAIAAITQNVAVRAGSVVLPLHSPVRVAEEWSLVDNISGGRAGVAFASGWHADDFVFFPDHYADRKDRTFAGIETVRRLWRGESVSLTGGSGTPVDVRVFPAPVQATLPTWITAAGTPETFTRAGAIGANVLTHLLGQGIEQVAENVRRYRQARLEHGHDPDAGTVTLMMHAYIGDDLDEVRELVRKPFTDYLRSSFGLVENLVRSLNIPVDLAGMSEADREGLLAFAVGRYFETSALFGTPDSVRPLVVRCAEAGVDEIACLVDFGLTTDVALAGLPALDLVRRQAVAHSADNTGEGPWTLADLISVHEPTLLQATPSAMRLVSLEEPAMAGLRSLRALLLGGEVLPPGLAETVRKTLPARLMNMYGPTETTVWSATHEVDSTDGPVPLGTPIANTQMHVVGADLRPVPVGVPGELLIGGTGVSRGYSLRPGMTAERFIPDPFTGAAGARLYRTGDLARRRTDGVLEFLGRIDRQVKVRGVRIELGDIESALCRRDDVREAVVVAKTGQDDVQLIGYIVPASAAGPTTTQLRDGLRDRVPQSMIPSAFVLLPELPHTANGKVDVKALAAMEWSAAGHGAQAPPVTDLERGIAQVWSEVLRVDSVGLYDNFFDLGGHSMLMVQAHNRLRGLVGELPLIKLLEHPTVSALAAYLSGAGTTASFAGSEERARKQRDSRKGRRGYGGRAGR